MRKDKTESIVKKQKKTGRKKIGQQKIKGSKAIITKIKSIQVNENKSVNS